MKTGTISIWMLLSALILAGACGKNNKHGNTNTTLTADSARAIAKEAWIYGYPMFYNYKSQYLYALDKNYPDNAGGFNEFKHYAKMFTYADTSIVTPNDDTPYSWAILNLSEEPIVLEVPEIDTKRYYVMQLIDLYTYNFAYIGTRTTGNKAGKYLIAGPNWKGEKPEGITEVFYSETDLVTVLGRTELMNEEDIPNIRKIQPNYKLTPLHAYAGGTAPALKQYNMPLPEWKESEYKGRTFINTLNILLQYTSTDASEIELRERFAKIGIIPGQPFDESKYSKEIIDAINLGAEDGEKALAESESTTTSSLRLFGSRADLKNDYLIRATAAAMGLFGNTKEEAVYVGSRLDDKNEQLMGENKYTLTFTKAQIPPVNYFWSTTMYSLPKRFLVKNVINRYAIGDRTAGLRYEKDGSLIIYLQSTSPGKDNENNWLPCPEKGPFNYVIRLYGPKPAVTDGTWKQPLPKKTT